MTVHWWMHWFWITTVVAALLLVPLATAHPTAGPTSPPSAAGGRSAHAGPRDWGSWPPPYEDEEDDEDGFLGPRALPLQDRAGRVARDADADGDGDDGASAPEELVPQDADVDGEILAEYAREVAASRAAAHSTNVPEGNARDVQHVAQSVSNSTAVDAVPSSQLNNSDSRSNNSSVTGARESKSFSSSVAPASVAPVKPLKAEAGHNGVDAEGKAGTARDRVPTSAPAAPAAESTSAAPGGAASGGDRAEPQAGDATTAAAAAPPRDSSDAPQPVGAGVSAEGSSPRPAEVDSYATAPAEAVSETGADVSSSPPEEETGWTAYDASAAAAADDDADVVGQQEEAVDLRSRTAEREAAEEEEVPEAEADAPVSRGRVAPAAPPPGAMDAASITGIALGIVVFSSLVGAVSFVMYRRRYLNKPQTLNDKCSNPDSSGYIDDSTLRENSEEMYSLDNDSFLNSLEAMTIQNYWTDNVKHTKL